jgi:hypothetical protein
VEKMNFPVFLNKWIISNRYLKYSSFWYWYRLINHEDYRLDDRFLYQDFWNSICTGQTQMVEDDKWMTYFGAKPETMYVSQEAYDELVRRINAPPKFNQKLYDLMSKKSPWEVEE